MTTKSLLHSSLLDNQYYNSMLVGNESFLPGAYHHLETYTVTGSPETIIEFSNLDTAYSGLYRHLQIYAVLRSDRSGAHNEPCVIRANSDSAANYSSHYVYGAGSSSGGAVVTTKTYLGISDGVASASAASGTFGGSIIDVANAFNTNTYKTFKSYNGYASPGFGLLLIGSGNWRSTNPISSLSFEPLIGTNFLVGSTISIFGLRS